MGELITRANNFGPNFDAPGLSKKTMINPATGKSKITFGETNTVETLWKNIKRRMWKIYNSVMKTSTDMFTQEILWRIENAALTVTDKDSLTSIIKAQADK